MATPKFFGAAVPQALREYVFLCERTLYAGLQRWAAMGVAQIDLSNMSDY